MTRSEAKEQIKRSPEKYFQRDKSGKGYICPLCGSGSGQKGTGITTKNGSNFHCWNCNFQGDVIEFIGAENHLTGFNEKLKRACEIYGIDFDSLTPDPGTAKQRIEDFRRKTSPTKEEQPEDFSSFYAECSKHRGESDYLVRRGISEKTQEHFNVGFCKNWRSPAALKKGYNPPPSPRLIIPTSKNSYLARDTRPEESLNEKELNFAKAKEGEQVLFNREAFKEDKPIFIVEGEIDAMSVYEVGFNALGLGSINQKDKFVEYVKKNQPSQTIILLLDDDFDKEGEGKGNPGKETAEYIKAKLREENLYAYMLDIGQNGRKYKDPNEFLVADREEFTSLLAQAADEATEEKEKIENKEREEYIEKNSALYALMNFIDGVSSEAATPAQPTGFKRLDEILDGGLYEGLYCIGAISSLGKTTLIMQIADFIAKSGRDVLIFSLEMARNEIIARSLSRITADIRHERDLYLGEGYVLSVRDITARSKTFDEEKNDLLYAAIDRHSQYTERLFIQEGIGNIGVKEIRESVKRHIHLTGNKPIIVVDYLQILAPQDPRDTDKRAVDKNILELKRISRDYKIPVIGISSFNRENYSATASMTAFKESGAIEYSSDVLMAMELKGAGQKDFDVDMEKKKNPREVVLKVLKNRNGATGGRVYFEYYPHCNYFVEAKDWKELDDWDDDAKKEAMRAKAR